MNGSGRRNRSRRYLAGGAVSLLGGGIFLVPVYDIWDDTANLSWGITTTLAENVLFLLLAAVILYSGIWLVRSDWETDHVAQVAKRTLVATFVVGFLIGWAVFLQLNVMDVIKPHVIALDGVVVGSAASLALSITSTRATLREEQVDAARARVERLELLYDAANDLESATSHHEAYDIVADAVEAILTVPSYRVTVDGDVIVDEWRPAPTDGATETVAIGNRGRIELGGERIERDDVLVVELFASYLDEAIQRIERESRLREERDLLEFVNRTLRHDLMSDVSLLEARLRMLDRNVAFVDDSQADNLEVALDRTGEMKAFIQTIRTYMESVLNEAHALEPVPLQPVIDDRVESFRAAYPEASVERGDVPAVAVEADDLIDRVFDNLLTNAVDHAQTPTPEISVDAERQGDVVTVRVADDGPGIPPDRRESIFEKGERGAESDGTGFGLYLVRDVVERYGGDARVRESDARGTVFELDFPVAHTDD